MPRLRGRAVKGFPLRVVRQFLRVASADKRKAAPGEPEADVAPMGYE